MVVNVIKNQREEDIASNWLGLKKYILPGGAVVIRGQFIGQSDTVLGK